MKTAIIIEDELDAQELLSKILEEYCLDVKVIGCASNIEDGKKQIENLNPDIVFLDIQLGEMTGFQLLDKLESKKFKLIITTAYQDFALMAFKYEAIDYVLKPYSPKSIIQALDKVRKQTADNDVYKKLESLLNVKSRASKISLPTTEGYTLVNTEDVIHVSADRSYCHIHFASQKKLFISKSLKDVEAILPNNTFFRLHTSHLINMNHLKMYNKEDGGYALMTNGDQVPIARRRKTEFLQKLTTNSPISFRPNS